MGQFSAFHHNLFFALLCELLCDLCGYMTGKVSMKQAPQNARFYTVESITNKSQNQIFAKYKNLQA